MVAVTETDAAAIRAVFTWDGALASAIGLRRRFSGIADTGKARACPPAGGGEGGLA